MPALSPALAPLPSPAATQRQPLREIGRVRAVTTFCKSFIVHFNNSAHLMTSNDEQISFIDFTLGRIEKRFDELGGELRFYEDRVRLVHWLDTLQHQIPVLQEEINQLRRGAALTSDPVKAKEAREVATKLQTSLDKQKQIYTDALGVLHAMFDLTAGKTKPELGSRFEHEMYEATTPEAMRDVRSYLKMDKQLDKIGEQESAAMTRAEVVVSSC